MRHVVEQGAVEYRKIDDPLDAGLAREVECRERLGHLIGRHGIQQEQPSTPFSTARIEAMSVMSPLTGSTPAGTLTLDASSRMSAQIRSLFARLAARECAAVTRVAGIGALPPLTKRARTQPASGQSHIS